MDTFKACLVALLLGSAAVGCGGDSGDDEPAVEGCGAVLTRCLRPPAGDAGSHGDGDGDAAVLADAGHGDGDGDGDGANALTCDQHTELGYGVCHIFSGPSAVENQASFCGLGIEGTACPDDAIGRCDLSAIGANPQGYVQLHYASGAIADADASKALCEAGGGAWSP
jgi:hypothetical protein